jgi:hypothetical protein
MRITVHTIDSLGSSVEEVELADSPELTAIVDRMREFWREQEKLAGDCPHTNARIDFYGVNCGDCGACLQVS